MSIFLQKLKIFIILIPLLGYAFVADAQSNVEYYQMIKNGTLVIEVPNGEVFIPSVGNASHGSLSLIGSGSSSGYGPLTYQPNTNFTGIDNFHVIMQIINPNNGIPESSSFYYQVEVSDGLIVTKRDFVSTLISTSVDVYPLDNDISTSNNLSLKPLSPIYNDGTVEIINDDQLRFTPANGFKGITHLGYIACDDFGICEKGMVSILVHDFTLPTTVENGNVLTSEDQPISVLMPYLGFEIEQQPSNGLLEIVPGEDFVYEYTPDAGFSGVDSFSFIIPGNDPKYYNVEATVMDIAAPNQFAIDDYAYTPIGKALDIDVVANDLGNVLGWSLTIMQAPSNGNAWKSNNKIHYTPNPGFEGIDQLVYRVADPFGNYEEATLYLTTSNFYPALTDFYLSTTEATNLALSYHVPVKGYWLEIVSGGSNGTATADDNLINYLPNNNFIGQDQFIARYHINGSSFDFTVHVDVVSNSSGVACSGLDCVWAGDTNRDGVVNGRDALLMCAVGEVGKARANANLNWMAQDAPDWNELVNGIIGDIKFVDTDGDSIITSLDVAGVDQNYGKVHNIYPQAVPTQQNPLVFIPNTSNPQPGDTIAIDVMMGANGNPAIDYSGISFEILYNATIFDTAWVEFDNHSWLGYDAPVLNYSKYAYDGKVDVAFTRGNETTKSGFGVIGKVYIVVDDISGIRTDEIVVNINSSYALGRGGHFTKLNDEKIRFQMDTNPFKEWNDVLTVYPNPTSDYVDLFLNGNMTIENIRILDMMGKEIRTVRNIFEKSVRLDVSNLQSGMYILDVETDKKPLARKLKVVRY